jgi:DNA-binding transcriptional regulator YiaG
MKPVDPPTPEAALVRKARLVLGMTQEQFSELLGYGGSRYVRFWESGKMPPRPLLLQWCNMIIILATAHGPTQAIELANGGGL